MSAKKSKHKGNANRVEQPRSVERSALLAWFDETLQPGHFHDYCPNGMQVQGRGEIRRLVTGVTASLRFLQAAAASGADAVLVHHGWFWRGEDPCLVGAKLARVQATVSAELSLFAYHLPLDAHPLHGNNVQLAERLGWAISGRAGRDELVFYTDLDRPLSQAQLTRRIASKLGRKPLVVGEHASAQTPGLTRIAWCTGGAQDAIDTAIELGADAYISGEVSERTTHTAREAGLLYFAAGHHATERFGVQALGAAASARFGIEHLFIDDPNPV